MANNPDFIPQPDGKFDEWQKNFVKHLSLPWPPPEEGAPAPAPAAPPAELLYKFLGIPVERYTALTEMQKKWDKDYGRGGAEADRRPSETVAKEETRVKYEKLLRTDITEFIRGSTKDGINEIKKSLKLTVPDTTASPSHGSHLSTGAPKVSLKNMGGSVIDIRCERIADEDLGSVPENFGVEIRWIAADVAPLTPDDKTGLITEVFSKARNQITCGMQNLKKTFYCWARWKHKTNAAFNSPWSDPHQITIA